MPQLTTRNNVKLYAETHGAGRPVVLIHGWPLDADAWAAQVPPLTEAGYQVITYDRRGFGRSDKPEAGYDYDTLADDLCDVLDFFDVDDVTLVGFSMGGGEVARYISRCGDDRIHSVVFAAAVPPYLLHTEDNPDGPLSVEAANEMEHNLRDHREGFLPNFAENFFTANGEVCVDQVQLDLAVDQARLSDQQAALACMESFNTTDFRADLTKVKVPTLVLHGDADAIVPFEGSGARTAEAIAGSTVHLIAGGPHGINASHPDEFNAALIAFLAG